MSAAIDEAKKALDGLGPKSGLDAIERYRDWLRIGGPKELLAEAIATQRLLDELTASDIGETVAHNQELFAQNQALHAEVRRLGGGML